MALITTGLWSESESSFSSVQYRLSRSEDMNYALAVFDRIENPHVFLWKKAFDFNSTGECRRKHVIKPHNFTLVFLLKLEKGLGSDSIPLGTQFHCKTVKLALQTHAYVRNSQIKTAGLERPGLWIMLKTIINV